MKKISIKIVKIIIKDWKYFTFIQLLKFNRVQIKLDSKNIVLIRKSHINSIFLIIEKRL